VVGLRDHFSGLGAASLVARGGLLLGGSVYQSGQVPGSQVGQLECQLGVLDDGIRQHLLVPVPDFVPLLDHLSISGDVGTANEKVAGADVLQVE
jgi:hypothetical protein